MTPRSPWGSLARHLLLAAAAFVMLYPLLWMLASSFREGQDIFTSISLLPERISLDAYRRGWNGLEVTFGHFLTNSAVIAVLSVAGNTMSCSLAAYAFARLRFRGRGILFTLMLGTLMIPYHVTLIPQYVLFLNLGWVNTILPLVVPKFLAADAFFIFLLVQFFRSIPKELDEAAMMDGCSPWRIYWKVLLPLSLPALATTAILSFIWTWDDFFGPLIYLNDITQYTAQIGLRAFVDSGGDSDWPALFAMSVLGLLPVFLFFLFFQRLLIDGIATTGIKR
ncbi:carbohydrate ABC transporter permease [Roseomonas sp. E05]|uniref:carbohydrate ABC transporter permease n=1 Tax=Roseomonas sp. E05 TaxID=3046310 RepID=UPI0024BAE4E8|nr:carbohydrate ABC transporter permease [Roseomonas sp. E05]MDJ0388854.1 carbohydrate ABC transporter permease [Roseomonas sp. E05]